MPVQLGERVLMLHGLVSPLGIAKDPGDMLTAEKLYISAVVARDNSSLPQGVVKDQHKAFEDVQQLRQAYAVA